MWAQSTAEIGRIIRAARLHRKLSQAEFAHMLGTTQAWVSEVEKGKETAQIGMVLRALNRLGVRLRTDTAAWNAPKRSESLDKGVDLANIIDTLSQRPPRTSRTKK